VESKILKTLKNRKNDDAYINEKATRGQARIFNLSKNILFVFHIVINCKMLSNRFSNNINYKARIVIESFLCFFSEGYFY